MIMILAQTFSCVGINIPIVFADITKTIINLIKIAIPVLLVIFGMLDLGKAVMAQKEDEIKKGQQTFLKRLLAAAIVFFVVFIVQFVIDIVARDEEENIWSCADKFINGV
jgi:surface polysaccharide O-acyltransferase-like enzyme